MNKQAHKASGESTRGLDSTCPTMYGQGLFTLIKVRVFSTTSPPVFTVARKVFKSLSMSTNLALALPTAPAIKFYHATKGGRTMASDVSVNHADTQSIRIPLLIRPVNTPLSSSRK